MEAWWISYVREGRGQGTVEDIESVELCVASGWASVCLSFS